MFLSSVARERLRSSALAKVLGNQRKLVQRSLQVFHNFRRDHVRSRQVGGVFQAIVLQPEDVQACFVALNQVVVIEGMEAFGFFSLVAILCVVAGDEIVQILATQWISL
jgi:hypothetical protein